MLNAITNKIKQNREDTTTKVYKKLLTLLSSKITLRNNPQQGDGNYWFNESTITSIS